MKIILFHSSVSKIGGIETLDYNLTKALSKKYDVLFMYNNIAPEQLERIEKFVQCEKYDKRKEYLCDVCICNSAWAGYPDSVTSLRNEYWQMIHADYNKMKETGWTYHKWKKTTRHIAVGQNVKDTFEKEYKQKADIIYNLLDKIQETKPILKLVSATRLSSEKGYGRMITLMNMLKESGIKFRWTIFTDLDLYKQKPIIMEEVIYMKTRYDIWDYIKEADYGVQLSDTEGYSYFINECLQYGTAMLVTNFKSAYESVIDGVNGYILDMDLSNLDLDKIVNKIPKDFKYVEKGTIKDWIKELGKPEKKEKYKYKPHKEEPIKIEEIPLDGSDNEFVKVRVLRPFKDSEIGYKWRTRNSEYIISTRRASEIMRALPNYIKVLHKVERR